MPSDAAVQPTFTYRGQNFLWGYSPDRQTCGLWRVDDPTGAPRQTWPIAEHEAAWRTFRSLELHAEPFPTAGAERVTAESSGGQVQARAAVISEAPAVEAEAPAPAVEAAAPAPAVEAAGPSAGAALTSSTAAPAPGRPTSPARKLALVALVSAVVALAAVLGIKAFGSNAPSNSSNPAGLAAGDAGQAVLTAATRTEGLQTAQMSMTETVRIGSQTITVPASGVVDFATGQGSIAMTVEGQHFTLLSSGGAIYMSIPQISQLLSGKSWVSVPITSSGAEAGGAFGAADPSQMLQFLASRGNTVSPLGPTTLDGVPVQGYSVMINKSAVENALQSSGLPAQIVQAGDQFLQSVGPLSYRVYIDTANQLRRMNFSMSIPGGSGGTLSAEMDLTDFGVPVSITAPPPSQVASLEQFLAATQH